MQTEVIVNGVTLDLIEDVSFPLNYWVRDLMSLEDRPSEFSKQVTLPGTPLIDKLFNHIYEVNYVVQTSGVVNFSPDFNPNLKADITVRNGAFQQFKGIMQLKDVRIEFLTERYRILYDVVLYGQTKGMFTKLGDLKLNELDWSDLNHTYNKATQTASWSAAVGSGYLYPMINYGVNSQSQSVQFNNTWDVKQFFPAIYLKEYVDRIFAYTGNNYTSSFFDSTRFKSLIVPFNGDGLKLTAAQISTRVFSATLTAAASGTVGNGVTVTIPYDNEVSDPGNTFSTITSEYTVPTTGTYIFTTQNTVDIFAITNASIFQASIGVRVTVDPVTGANYSPSGNAANYALQTGTLTAGSSLGAYTITVQTGALPLNAGDIVRAEVYVFLNPNYTLSGTLGYRVAAGGAFSNSVVNNGLVEGDTVDVGSCVPLDIRCVDFMRWVFQMFNLIVEPDKTNPETFYNETATGFYSSGTTLDWTTKLDIGKPFVIKPMGLLNAKRYVWRYKPDSDYYNKLYQDEYIEPYGTRTYDVTNDFVCEDKVTEIGFSPTPLEDNLTNDRIISAIYYVGSNGTTIAKRSNIRMLYYGGLKTTATGWAYTSISGNSTETTYPYAGHLDNPASPNFDLCFEPPKRVYYIANQYTDGNLFNLYHKQFIEEITDKSSKLVTAFFKLDSVDIHVLSFRDKIFIQNTFYRLYRVIDYDTLNRQVTKCELLKIKDGIPFTKTTQSINGGYFETIGQDENHGISVGGGVSVGNNSGGGVSEGTVLVGRGNGVSGDTDTVIVSGERSFVHGGSRNVTLIATSGVTVQSGASNVIAINTSGVTISNSNEVWINNIRQPARPLNVTGNLNINVPGDYFCNGTFTVTLIPANLNGGEIIKVSNIGSGTITISGGGALINGLATQTLSVQYDSYTIHKVGNQFIIMQ